MRQIARGVNPVDLQSVMRHTDFKTTQAFYLRSDAEAVARRLAERGEQYLGTPADEPKEKATSDLT
jgi:hypothetical protein